MSEIGVNFAEVARVQGDLQKADQVLNGRLEDLKSDVQKLAAAWTGEAAEAYQARQQQWDQSAADMNQILKQIHQALQRANEDFGATEKGNTSIWG